MAEYSPGICAATKAFVPSISQNLPARVGQQGIYVQAVLPAATRTEIYDRSGGDISKVPNVTEVYGLVDAAVIGFDRKELVTLPPVPDVADWEAFEQAHMVLAGPS